MSSTITLQQKNTGLHPFDYIILKEESTEKLVMRQQLL